MSNEIFEKQNDNLIDQLFENMDCDTFKGGYDNDTEMNFINNLYENNMNGGSKIDNDMDFFDKLFDDNFDHDMNGGGDNDMDFFNKLYDNDEGFYD